MAELPSSEIVDVTAAGSGDPVAEWVLDRPIVDRVESEQTYLEAVRASGPPAEPRRHGAGLRLLDLFGAVVGLVVLVPLWLVAMAAIRFTSPGAGTYSQERIGRHGVPFRCLKLRTMRIDAAEQLGPMLQNPEMRQQWDGVRKLQADPRITPVGRLLRRIDLDEIPQLWNVLQGHMSLVGPRPVPADEAELYGPDLATVLLVRPGMTGLWQVSGRNDISYSERIELDVRYVREQSIGGNLRLIGRTIWLILSGKNAAS